MTDSAVDERGSTATDGAADWSYDPSFEPEATMRYTPMTAEQFGNLADLDTWATDGTSIRASFRAPSFAAAGSLVAAIAEAADEADHHPDVDLRFPGVVHVTLSTHDVGGLSDADVEMARSIEKLAAARVKDAAGSSPPAATTDVGSS